MACVYMSLYIIIYLLSNLLINLLILNQYIQFIIFLEYEDDSRSQADTSLIARLLKLAGNSQIAACVNNGLTGIPLLTLAVQPDGIRRRPQAVCFEPDKRSPLWARLVQQDTVLALHIDGQLRNFTLNAYLITGR
ncbi:MAG TPA: hypothetical protein DIT05_04530 [Morganella sp. (in: Bacteria)]|nr:hypothetical protein [Morganella sp. (in: enterobacteria)]